MKQFLLICTILSLFSCVESNSEAVNMGDPEDSSDFTLVFASCSDQEREQPLWGPIVETNADLFVWGGDNVYSDTDDMEKMKNDYNKAFNHPKYSELRAMTTITGTWDDHDYGLNDAGSEWSKKQQAKDIFLDFLEVPEEDVRRKRAGVYTSEMYQTEKGSLKLILLDTRWFRDSLRKSSNPNWRYDPWEENSNLTILGDEQWNWLENELKDGKPDFTLIVSSIQFLSDNHGWEKWANFPSEVKRMETLLKSAVSRNVLFLSGDRHLAEISVATYPEISYPIVDFTSSGMTHTWIDGATESNAYRISNVVKRLNFGVLKFDFENEEVTYEIRGEDNFLYERHIQKY
ncbi:MAG: alkaline phosphatase family protein [Flavobacteriaceae bacterium]|nr:alkaline phosphatase family protein [Flavobacteriaceae bacterium]